VLAPYACDPQALLSDGQKVRSSTGKGHRSIDLVQEASQDASNGSCAVNEIGGALALVHLEMLCADDLRGFRNKKIGKEKPQRNKELRFTSCHGCSAVFIQRILVRGTKTT